MRTVSNKKNKFGQGTKKYILNYLEPSIQIFLLFWSTGY